MRHTDYEEPLLVVIIDDVEEHATMLRRSVDQIAGELAENVEIRCHDDPALAFAGIAGEPNCVVICDYKLEGCTAPEWIPYFVRSNLGPVLVTTSSGSEEAAIETFHCGASDYLNKMTAIADPDYLSRAIKAALRRHRLTKTVNDLAGQLRRANRELEHKNTQLENATKAAHAFVDDVAHDFRTPISVVKEFASLISDGLDGPVTDEQREHLGFIQRASDDLNTMVDDFLDSARLRAGLIKLDRKPVAPSALYNHIAHMISARAKANGVEIKNEIPSDLPKLFCDASKAARILTNLAINAVKFSPEGSTVTISAAVDDCWVAFRVADQGPGINAEDVQRIFQRYQQCPNAEHAKVKGFGLGLSIACQLAAMNFGRLDVESAKGKGSVFSVCLPLADPQSLLKAYTLHSALRDTSDPMAILRVTTEQGAEQSHVRSFLSKACWVNDLVAPENDGTLLVAGLAAAPDRWIERLQREARQWNADHPHERVTFSATVETVLKPPYSEPPAIRKIAPKPAERSAAA